MSQEFQTLREASLSVASVNKHLTVMTGVFVATLAMGVGGFSYLNSKVDGLIANVSDIKISSAKQTVQLDDVNTKLAQLVTGVQAIPERLNSQAPSPQAPTPQQNVQPKAQASLFDRSAPLVLDGVNPNVLQVALKTHTPPNGIIFALAARDAAILDSFHDIIGGSLNDREPGLLTFDAMQIYNLPLALRKFGAAPFNDLVLFSTDGSYNREISRVLYQASLPK